MKIQREMSPALARGVYRIQWLLLFVAVWAIAAAGRIHAEPAAASATGPCIHNASGALRPLSGTVSDATGAGIAHASITLRCGDFQLSTTADATGTYSLVTAAGRYTITAAAENFDALDRDVVVADTGTGTEIHLVLKPQQVHSTVTVTAGNAYLTTVNDGGTKTDLPLMETPQAISVVNRDLMDAQNVVKLDDALKNVAGVIAGGYYDGWDYYRIRGFDASFNTYIDGLRGGNGMAEETWGLERVEVLKGPSSALYGQSVLGGLVNIVTRKPVPADFAHLQLTEGSFNFTDPAVDLGHVFDRAHTFYGRVAALFHSGDTFVDYTHRNRYYVAPSISWTPSSSTSLTLIGRVQRDNGRQGMPLPALGTVTPSAYGLIPINRYIGELEANANKMQQANQQFGYQLQHKWGDSLTLRQNARFAWYQQEWNRIYYPSYLDPNDARILYRYPLNWHGPWQTHEVDTHLEGHGSFGKMEHTALLGVDFYRSPTIGVGYSIDFSNPSAYEPLNLYNPVYGANPVQSLILYSDSSTVTQYTGIYLQDHIRMAHRITVTGGGRVDLAKNESKGSANQNSTGLTPRLGITWQAVPSTTLYANFSKSFMPQSGQAWNGTTSGSYLPPERGVQWEAGTKSSFLNGRLAATMALFQLDRKNVATTDPSHANFSLVTGEQRSRGVELEATLNPRVGWNITAAYSYIDAEVLHDTTIPAGTPTLNAPKNLLNFWTTYEVQHGFLRGFSFGFGGRHATDQAGDQANSFQLPGYGLADASVSYRRGRTLWQLNANNVTNARYFSGSYNNVYVKPGEPRTVHGVVSWNF